MQTELPLDILRSEVPAEAQQLILGDAIDVLDTIDNGSCRLVVTSPPYNIGKEYERGKRLTLQEYLDWLRPIVTKLCEKISDDGHVCWQTGNFVDDGEVFPLDLHFYQMFKDLGFKLRNRIIWHFNFGLHAQNRFSGRYETILWFSKSDDYVFNLDPVRVPQQYPGKRHSSKKAGRAGLPSGNPLGKNPSDFWTFDCVDAMKSNPVWDFPNVKANHPEKTIHPCQFPSELVERCILSLTNPGDIILDPFIGSGTTAIAAAAHNRIAIGIDKDPRYIEIARHRLDLLAREELARRPLGKPVRTPKINEGVAQVPAEWLTGRDLGGDNCDDDSSKADTSPKEEEIEKTQADAGPATGQETKSGSHSRSPSRLSQYRLRARTGDRRKRSRIYGPEGRV